MFTQIRNILLWSLVACLTLIVAPLTAQTDSGVLDQTGLAKIDPALLAEIETDGEADFFIWLTDQADLSAAYQRGSKLEKGNYVFETLRQTAETAQKDLRAFLDAQGAAYRPFYVANAIIVYGGRNSLLLELAARPDVARLLPNRQFQLEEPMVAENGLTGGGVEPNIVFIRATEVWDMGVAGEGIVLAGGDTGIQWNHPALINQYRGWDGQSVDHNYNWWDATGQYPMVPGDGHGHGTHISGTMVGDDGGDNRIGVAPGAQVIHCKNMTDGGSGSDATFMDCFEWVLAPWDLNGQNPRPDLAPHAMNNSWGYWGGGAPQFVAVIENLHAAGILIEVSAGNEGADCGTLRSPGDYDFVLTTGSVGHFSGVLPGSLTSFSSRGPSSLYPDAYFPTIMAPGEGIRSSLPGNGYEAWSGTSMAGPHATALVGLMWSANPALTGLVEDTLELIKETAVPLTGVSGSNCGGDYVTGPNNDWGWGTIDAYAAVEAAIAFGGVGHLHGTVVELDGGAPILGVAVRAVGPFNRTAVTNAAGEYTLRLPAGVYDITASKYGYVAQTVAEVEILEDESLEIDFELDFAEMHTVSGLVADANTGWPLYARINISGYPYGPVWSDPVTGAYSVELASDFLYTFNVSGWVEGYLPYSQPLGPLTDDEIANFDLNVNVAACSAPGYQSIFTFEEDFEGDVGKWSASGLWHLQNEADACGSQVAPFPSPTNAFYFGDADMCNYDVGLAVGSLALIDSLTIPAQGAALYYWSYEATECGGACPYDRRLVEVSTDEGASWTAVAVGHTEGIWHQRVADLLPFAGQDVHIRFTFDSGDEIENYFFGWMVDDVALATGCEPQPGSLVVGNVYDANNGDGLPGATVFNEAGYSAVSQATPLDPNVDDGFYTLFAPEGANALTAAKARYGEDYAEIVVGNGQTVRQDFSLAAAWLVADPDSPYVELTFGETMTATLDLLNQGGLDAQFDIRITPAGFEPVGISIPASDGSFPRRRSQPSVLAAPETSSPNRMVRPSAELLGPLSGAPAFAVDVFPGDNLVYFYADSPDMWDIIAPMPANGYFAGDFVNGDFSLLYLLSAYWNELHAVDTTTGAITVIGPAQPLPGQVWTGMTAAIDGTVYVASTDIGVSYLYTIDETSGAVSLIGPITNAPCIIDVAISPAFEMYGLDICNDELVRIDPTTGEGEVIGWIGFDANYAQGMDFEEESGLLYLAAFNDWTWQGEFRVADTETGATTLISPFPNGAEVTALAFATYGGGVAWLSVEPEAGDVPAYETTTLTLTFDAAVPEVDQPGIYNARLRIANDSPYGPLVAPVTMNVLPTPTMGKLSGYVTTSGYCDADTQPLPRATVRIEAAPETFWEVTTNGQGYYQFWLDESYSPLTVTVMRDGYQTETAENVIIVAGETTPADFDLRWLVPCLNPDPAAFDVALDFGDATVETLTLFNDGGGEAEFYIFSLADWGMDALWLSADPDFGAIPADDSLPISVTFDADQVVEPGLHLGYLFIMGNDPVHEWLTVPVSMTVTALPTTGILEGFVTSPGYCDANPTPVAGATILIESANGKAWTVTTNEEGYYYRWLNETDGPFDLTVWADDYAEATAFDVAVIGQDTVAVDFDVRWLVPCLIVDPETIYAEVAPGEEAVITLTIENQGGGDAAFSFRETFQSLSGRTAPIQVNLPGMSRAIPDGSAVAQSGLTRFAGRPAWSYADANQPAATLSNVLLLHADDGADPLYSILLAYPDIGLVDEWNVAWWGGVVPPLAVLEMYDVVIVWSNYDYVDAYALGDLLADYVDGGGFVILSVFNWGFSAWGLQGRFVDEGYSPFVSLDWGNHYQFASLGEHDAAHPLMAGVTAASDLFRDIVTLHPDAALVASWDDGEPFVAYKESVVAINAYTGPYYMWTGDVGVLFHNAVNFVQTGDDVPWLSVEPTTGVVPADGSLTVDVALSALSEMLVGRTYEAGLRLGSNDPVNRRINIPAAMYITPPESYGVIDGRVMGLGYCDADPSPLMGAELLVTAADGQSWLVESDWDGYYYIWVDEANGPYELSLFYPDHELGAAEGVLVAAQQTTTVNFDLRWLAACVRVEPDSLSVVVPRDGEVSLTWRLINAGAVSANFAIFEKAEESAPGFGAQAASAGVTNIPPAAYEPSLTTSSLTSAPSLGVVAVFKDADAWGATPVEQILAANDIPYEVHGSAAFGVLDFAAYHMIVLSGDQPQSFYNEYAIYAGKFEDYVFQGGFLNFFAADYGWNGGMLNAPLPSGVVWNSMNLEPANIIDDPEHPVAAGVPSPFYGDYASHGYFSNLPADAHLIASGQYSGMPTSVEYRLGAGVVLVLGQPLEISYAWGWDAGQILVNALLWGYAHEPWQDVPWLSQDITSGEIPADGAIEISVTFTPEEGMELGEYLATLILINSDRLNRRIDVPVSMLVADFGLELWPTAHQLSGHTGQTVYYTLIITNTGTAADSYNFAVGNHLWPATLPGTLTLAAQETGEVLIGVAIPSDAVEGATDTVSVTVVSLGDGRHSAVATLTTTANRYYRFFPLITR